MRRISLIISLIKKQEINHQEKEEQEYTDNKKIKEIQPRKARQVDFKNKIYEKNQIKFYYCSKLNVPKKYDEYCFLVKSEPLDYTEAVESKDLRGRLP